MSFTESGRISLRSHYVVHDRVQRGDWGESMAKQEFKKDTDINHIMKRFLTTGLLDHVAQYRGQYADLQAISFHEAMNAVAEAQQMFETLPSNIRDRFGNDPQAFLDFVSDEENRDEARKMGLIPNTGGKHVDAEGNEVVKPTSAGGEQTSEAGTAESAEGTEK